MLTLYKKTETHFLYQQAWQGGNKVVHHWGVVGSKGNNIERHRWDKSLDLQGNLLKWLQAAIDKGFKAIPSSDMSVLVIEYETKSSELDYVAQRQRLEKRLSDHLGWTALGWVDGGSIGSGSMEVFCLVVDYCLAKQSIEHRLNNYVEYQEHKDYKRIYQQIALDDWSQESLKVYICEDALRVCREREAALSSTLFSSIESQLVWLLDYINGKNAERERLSQLNFGHYAVREIDPGEAELIMVLKRAFYVADRISRGLKVDADALGIG